MNSQTQAIGNNLDQLTRDAKTLMSETGDMAEEKIKEAHHQLACLLGRGKEMYALARDKALEGTRVTDVAVHEHLYQTIAIGVGIGALIGYFVASRSRCRRD